MKKIFITAAVIGFIGLPTWLWAQDDVKKDKETEEIVIRNKGDKDMDVTVQIKGDKVIVNGKPLAEFKDDDIIINKRKMIIRDGDDMMAFDFGADGQSFNLDGDFIKSWKDKGKETKRTFLGVTTEKTDQGAKITEVVEASAAAKAGLKEGDIITKIDKEKITDGQSLTKFIKGKKPNDEVKIYYKRDGKDKNVKATLGEKTEKKGMSFSFKGNPEDMMRSFHFPPGTPTPPLPPNADMFDEGVMPPGFDEHAFRQFEFNNIPRQKKLGLKIQDTEEGGNVKVIDVDDESAAASAGVKKGDVITEINGTKINNTDDAREQLKPKEGKTNYTIKAKRDGKEMSFDVKIPKKLKTADL
ncbi:MAG: PDZ domain-containing protein [Bacteroidota bacterium]